MHRFVLSGLIVLLAAVSLRAQVVINEVMYYPDPNEPEWVELYNAGSESVSIKNWTIREDSNSSGSEPFSITLEPGTFVVITGNASAFAECWGEIPAPVVEAGFSFLNNNGGDCVRLRGNGLESIDEVCYEDTWGGRSGKSLERRSPFAPSADSATWGSSIDGEKGTPGRTNSLTTTGVRSDTGRTEESHLRIVPNPAHDYFEVAFDENVLGRGHVRIITADGRTVRRLENVAGHAEISLKGLPAGLYLVEVIGDINHGGGPIRRRVVIER